MAGYSGSGDMIARFKDPTTGAYGAWSGKIYTSAFQLDVASELVELQSKGRDDFNVVIGSVANPQPQGLSFTLRGGDLDMFRMSWLATVGTLSQASGSVTDESVNAKGSYFKVVGRDITVPVVTNAAGSTTYVLGTDYVVENARLGLFRIIAGSSLATAVSGAGATGLTLLVDYTRAAVTGTQFLGGLQPNLIAEVLFDGRNRANLKAFDIRIPEAVISPAGGFDLLGDGFGEAAFNARLVLLSTETAPFYANWPQGV
jgi:hypothetical protein